MCGHSKTVTCAPQNSLEWIVANFLRTCCAPVASTFLTEVQFYSHLGARIICQNRKNKAAVLGSDLGLESQVFGLGLGLESLLTSLTDGAVNGR